MRNYGFGAWTLAVAAAGAFAGSPATFAVMSLVGGGGLLVAAGVARATFCRPSARG